MTELPKHLRKYIVTQNYEKYTPVDQASWRYILRQLKAFLAKHAHECYLDGLEKTGVEIEEIPHIENISKKLEKYGWRALPVSGFIPPAAFMELQSLGVLPIASDMRTLQHLSYTPAPDIVHEAAGHAPILINPEFSKYLRQYAKIARKAIISKEDLDIYDAIRTLSDLKEMPDASDKKIEEAQNRLNHLSKNISHASEASLLSRMNWWTAEYGLIGKIDHPKIFGAGLLSSVGESRLCLSEKVRKIPLTVDCIRVSYDITEPQPQLFVAPDFAALTSVLDHMANQMAFRTGGLAGVQKAIQAKTINTVELNSGVQISGQFCEVITASENEEKTPVYLRSTGASQLSYLDHELPGHSKSHHSQGFGTAIGYLQNHPELCPSLMSDADLKKSGIEINKKTQINFSSGVRVEGKLKSVLRKDGKILVMSFEDASVTYKNKVLFEPAWGTYDLAMGSSVVSVFGGPADRSSYGETEDFVASRVPTKSFTEKEKALHHAYASVRKIREEKITGKELSQAIALIWSGHLNSLIKHWLLALECYELLINRHGDLALAKQLRDHLELQAQQEPALGTVIEDGLALAKHL